jgi:hypothetical protein
MNWVKTYESFIFEKSEVTKEVDNFEDLINLTKNSGVITDVQYDESKKILTVDLLPKLNHFDIAGVMNAINKNKAEIKKEFRGVNQIHVDSIIISI